MGRGTYLDTIKKSSVSAPTFLRSFAEEKVAEKEPDRNTLSPEDKLIRDYENDPNPPGGFVQMAYHAAKKSRGETSFADKFKKDVANDPDPSPFARALAEGL
tara:strand:- start:48 stop:353 length:306 start_codon:yes stop_codon:yes gene_type:complete